ncbi:translation initiation factor IF-1, partial [Dysosmobacter welbionis]
QKVFFADNTLADVVSGIQCRHVIRLQQHLQAVGGVLLANGEALVRQLPRHIAHDAVVIFLIKRLLQASGIDDQ